MAPTNTKKALARNAVAPVLLTDTEDAAATKHREMHHQNAARFRALDVVSDDQAAAGSPLQRRALELTLSAKSRAFVEVENIVPIAHSRCAREVQEVLARMDKDLGGLIEEDEWTQYATYCVEHENANAVNDLDHNLQRCASCHCYSIAITIIL